MSIFRKRAQRTIHQEFRTAYEVLERNPPLDDNGAQLFFRLVAAAYEQRSLGIGSHWPFEEWGRFLPEPTTAVSLLDRLLHHAVVAATEGESYRMKQARTRGPRTTTPTT